MSPPHAPSVQASKGTASMTIENAVTSVVLTLVAGILWVAWRLLPSLPAMSEAVTIYTRAGL